MRRQRPRGRLNTESENYGFVAPGRGVKQTALWAARLKPCPDLVPLCFGRTDEAPVEMWRPVWKPWIFRNIIK
jgi:hypothetical protein